MAVIVGRFDADRCGVQSKVFLGVLCEVPAHNDGIHSRKTRADMRLKMLVVEAIPDKEQRGSTVNGLVGIVCV